MTSEVALQPAARAYLFATEIFQLRNRRLWRRLLGTLVSFASGQLVISGLFFADMDVRIILAVLFLPLYLLVVLCLWIGKRRKWQEHAVAVALAAGAASTAWLGLVLQFDNRGSQDADFAIILGSVLAVATAALWVSYAFRRENNEAQSIRFAYALIAGSIIIAILQFLFFPVMGLDGGREAAALGPLTVFGAAIAYFISRKERFAWVVWPVAAILSGIVYSAVAAS